MGLAKILAVEDDPGICALLTFVLQRSGFSVVTCQDAWSALRKLNEQDADLLIVDWMLPEMDGCEMVRMLRARERTSELPIIMLTAKGEEGDLLEGFKAGVDDYIVKPFSTKVLVARVKAILRRLDGGDDAPHASTEELTFEDITLDIAGHRLLIQGQAVDISFKNFQLLQCLMRNPDRALSREQLLGSVWGRNRVETRTIDVHILSLRKILEASSMPHCIQTVRGLGYRFSSQKHPD